MGVPHDELVALEREGWAALSGGDPAAFYDRVLASHAVMVFSFGALNRDDAVAAMAQAPPWDEHELSDVEVRELAPGIAVVVYRVQARRGDEPYEAMLASTYVCIGDDWRLAMHQQSP